MQMHGMHSMQGGPQGMHSGMRGGMRQQEETAMTEEQIAAVQDIISNYDIENMTIDDQTALREELRAADIPPSSETRALLEEAGITLERPEFGSGMQMGQASPPPHAHGYGTMSSEDRSFFTDILEQVEAGSLSADELLSQIEAYSGKTSGSMLDLGA